MEGFPQVEPLVLDTGIPGERKRDGVIPMHPAVLRLSRSRWALFLATLENGVWDGTRSILWQLRDGAPHGPILKEGIVRACVEGWDPLGRGDCLSRRCGTPVAFGVPKGATRNGRPLPTANRFVLRWYVLGFPFENGRAVNPLCGRYSTLHPEAKETAARTFRVEGMQFRLNDAEDDLEILQPPRRMHERGCPDTDEFSSLGGRRSHVLGLTPPLAAKPDATEWLGFDTLAPWSQLHGEVAAVGFRFDPATGLYEWVRTGSPIRLNGLRLGEASTLRLGGRWVVAVRDFGADGRTRWLQMGDPFAPPERVLAAPPDEGPRESPRTAYACADGALRLFGNNNPWRTRGRSVLYAWEVDPETFAFTRRQTVFAPKDAGLPFANPHVDMPKLAPAEAGAQRLVFRLLAAAQVSRHDERALPADEEHRHAGIYHAVLGLGKTPAQEWTFAG